MRTLILLFILVAVHSSLALAYPEFQRYSKNTSGRSINCSMCHMHSDGPDGLKPGQIGSLNPDELKVLGMARQAFKPGSHAKSPILNEFGNVMLNDLGKEKIAFLRQKPELLAKELSKTSDLDSDGITDAEEFVDGTHPLNSLDGRPWKLFKNNFNKNWFHILMMVLATTAGLYGLHNALLWLAIKAGKEK
jgi:hypothetical protein